MIFNEYLLYFVTLQTLPMKRAAHIHPVLMVNLRVSTADAFLNRKFAMASMIVKITQRLMKHTNAVQRIQHARQIISNAKKPTFALNHIGFVMETTVNLIYFEYIL